MIFQTVLVKHVIASNIIVRNIFFIKSIIKWHHWSAGEHRSIIILRTLEALSFIISFNCALHEISRFLPKDLRWKEKSRSCWKPTHKSDKEIGRTGEKKDSRLHATSSDRLLRASALILRSFCFLQELSLPPSSFFCSGFGLPPGGGDNLIRLSSAISLPNNYSLQRWLSTADPSTRETYRVLYTIHHFIFGF